MTDVLDLGACSTTVSRGELDSTDRASTRRPSARIWFSASARRRPIRFGTGTDGSDADFDGAAGGGDCNRCSSCLRVAFSLLTLCDDCTASSRPGAAARAPL